MLKKYSKVLLFVFYLTDIFIVMFLWFLAYYIRFHSGLIPLFSPIPPFTIYKNFSLIIILAWTAGLKISNVYKPMRGRKSLIEFLKIGTASILSIVIMIIVAFFFRGASYSRLTFLIFFIITPLVLTSYHIFIRTVLAELRSRGYNLRHIVILGRESLGRVMMEKVFSHPENGLVILGYLPEGERWNVDIPCLGSLSNLVEVLEQYKPDQLILAFPIGESLLLEDLLFRLKGYSGEVKVIPNISNIERFNYNLEDIAGYPLLNLEVSRMNMVDFALKRIMDILLSSLLILILSPLFLLVSILIKIFSVGPVFFTQERMGINGKVFIMYKFRTMIVDAELETGPVWARVDDKRITGIGKILRRGSIDELPQLFNVLRGDMSLVGPRPERPLFVKEFINSLPRYILRHQVKTGITGWAQVNGFRGNTSVEKRLEYDLYYLENWSIWFDIKIIVLTVFGGYKDKNAY